MAYNAIWISIAQSGIIIKRSRLGLFGATLYKETVLTNFVPLAQALYSMATELTTPPNMTTAVLKAFTHTAISSKTSAEMCEKIAKAKKGIL